MVWLISVPQSPALPETVILHNPRPHMNHTVSGDCLAWPRAPAEQRLSFQAGCSESSEVISQELSGSALPLERARCETPRTSFFLHARFARFPAHTSSWFRIPHCAYVSCLSHWSSSRSLFVFYDLETSESTGEVFLLECPLFTLRFEKVWMMPPPKEGTGRRVEGLGVVANHEGGVGARRAKGLRGMNQWKENLEGSGQ